MRKPVAILVALAGIVSVAAPSLTAQKKEDTPKKTTAKPTASTTQSQLKITERDRRQSQPEPIQNNQDHAGIRRLFISERPEAA